MGNMQVLVIEDEHDSMEVVQGLLEHHGIDSVGASSGEEALEILREMSPYHQVLQIENS